MTNKHVVTCGHDTSDHLDFEEEDAEISVEPYGEDIRLSPQKARELGHWLIDAATSIEKRYPHLKERPTLAAVDKLILDISGEKHLLTYEEDAGFNAAINMIRERLQARWG